PLSIPYVVARALARCETDALSLHDALPILAVRGCWPGSFPTTRCIRNRRWHELHPLTIAPTCPMSAQRGFGPEITGSPTRNNRTDRKSTRLNSSHVSISYAVFCLIKRRRSS